MMTSTRHVSGFTLVETMVAVSILALAVVGPLMVAQRALLAAQISQERTTASFLAQEGIEYVRWMRDDAYLNAYKNGGTTVSSDAWQDFTTGASVWSITSCEGVTCTLDSTRPMGTGSGFSLNTCSGSTCTALRLSHGFYIQSNVIGSTVTPFTRTIEATTVSSTDEQIVSTVTWDFHGVTYSVTTTDHLTPWQ